MTDSLGDRQKEYEAVYDVAITRRLPIVIRVDGRSFHRLTRNLPKPHCIDFEKIMAQTMLYTIMEMQGAVFGYTHNDEITFILKNDQSFEAEPWYQNRIQKMVSVTSSLCTRGFDRAVLAMENKLELVGDAIFDARTFPLPYISEVVNNLIWRQQSCIRDALSAAAQHELSQKFGSRTAIKLLDNRTSVEKKEMLLDHCGIDYDEYYSSSFRKGMAAYKTPTLIPLKEGVVSKNKWILDDDLPIFHEDKDFVYNILINGHDVFRAPEELINIGESEE